MNTLTPDLINGFFELIGSCFILYNCSLLIKAKIVQGISIWTNIFFTSWGVFNIWYFGSLTQHYSVLFGVILSVVNITWIILAIYYTRNQKNNIPNQGE